MDKVMAGKAEGDPSAPSVPRYTPGKRLLPDETEVIRSMASELNRLYALLSPIADCYEERAALSTMPRRCRECAALESCPEWTFLPKYRTTALYPAGIPERSGCSIPSDEQRNIVSGCLSKTGHRGRSGDNPIDSILWDLKALRDRTETLLRTGSLQTIDTRMMERTCFRLSDGGRFHALIDISIDSSEPPLYSGPRGALLTKTDRSGSDLNQEP